MSSGLLESIAAFAGIIPEEILEEVATIACRRLKCARCGLGFGAERIDWTGFYYHPRWECDMRLAGDTRSLKQMQNEVLSW